MPRVWFSAARGPAMMGSGRFPFIIFPTACWGEARVHDVPWRPAAVSPSPPHRTEQPRREYSVTLRGFTASLLSLSCTRGLQVTLRTFDAHTRARAAHVSPWQNGGRMLVGITATNGRAICKAKPVHQVPSSCPAASQGGETNRHT